MPVVTVGLLVVIGLAHLLAGLIGFSEGRITLAGIIVGDRPTSTLVFMGAMFGPKVGAGEVWRLVSCLFLHGDGTHILLNGIALYGLGRLCESVYGPTRFLWLFLFAGMSGSTLSFLGGNVASVGASGSIFGPDGGMHCLWVSLPAGSAATHRRALSQEAAAVGRAQPRHRAVDSVHRQSGSLRRPNRRSGVRDGGLQPHHRRSPTDCLRVSRWRCSLVCCCSERASAWS